ncbi:MAG: electron transport complex subunit RsxC [Muribaculaceae bacterium]|nr:electron transport complex subunit RsxC [Muribaculaceae bacterium]
MRKKTFSKGGIHPEAHKDASPAIELLPLPEVAVVPLSQHIGAPASPGVAKGDKVRRGDRIAVNPSFVSAGMHAPISGTVTAIEPVVMANGKPSTAIIIKASPEEHEADTAERERYWTGLNSVEADRDLSESVDAADIRRLISDAGIVGLGGATFPSHVKLTLKDDVKAEVLIINGCECEPYLMCDDALMRAYPSRIVEGVELMMKAAGIPRAVIAIEDNKPEAARAIESAIDGRHDISLQILRTRYPQGGEKQLVEAVTGRRIASGALPVSVGAIVNNVATAFSVWQAVDRGVPLIERVVTITGDIPADQRRNYLAAIGTPLADFPFTVPDDARVIAGGPMMGKTAVRLDAPVIKGTSGLTILSAAGRRPVQPCIRCGACVEVCPMGLEPYLLSTYGRLRMWDEARDNDVADCIECGSCSYSCPSARPLLDYIRVARQRSRQSKQ